MSARQVPSRWCCWRLAGATALVLLTACGGGSGATSAPAAADQDTVDVQNSGPVWEPGVYPPFEQFAARCEDPRTGVSPVTGEPYPDRQGTTLDQNNWLRSWVHDRYLWYDEVPDLNPANFSTPAYFDRLRTPETRPSGVSKDPFHFSRPTLEWQQQSQAGVVGGFGARWAVLNADAPRNIAVAYVEPDSPADAVGELARGTRILQVDDVDVVAASSQAEVDLINRILFRPEVGSSHTLTVRDLDGTERTVTLTAENIQTSPVLVTDVLETAGQRVGYMLFNDHNAMSEQALVETVEAFAEAGVQELVLDLRYNGGGLLAIASQVAYMVAGQARTEDRTFEALRFSDKHPRTNPVTGQALTPIGFRSTTLGFSATPSGQPLPTLDLERLLVLTGGDTCSASESIMNALRGIDLEVIQMGARTCGKPYGTYPEDNCGTTYFIAMFQGVNDKGFGDYFDGFLPHDATSEFGVRVPGCSVADDFGSALGAPDEARLAAALHWIERGDCPVDTMQGVSSSPLLQWNIDASRNEQAQPMGLRVMQP